MNWSHQIIAKPLNHLEVQFPKLEKEDYGVKSAQYLVHILNYVDDYFIDLS